MNIAVLTGRLTKDIEMRNTQSGASVVSFTLACERKFKQQGQPDTDFINCVAWNKTAELMNKYLSKGSLIGVEGRINTRNYDDKEGKRVYITEVVVDTVQFLESKREHQNNNYENSIEENISKEIDIDYDDLPF